MSSDNEIRASRLAERVEEIEKMIRSGGKAGGVFLAAMLETEQGKLDALRYEEDKVAVDKKEREQKDRSAIAQMVEREAKLNKEEKEKYADFLAKDYFTKSDMKDLDQFYGHSWSKLSEEGKDQMTKRVAEGIRRGEFTYDQLPETVKEREADRLPEHGIDVSKSVSGKNEGNRPKASQYIGKSASNEADSSKEIEPEEKQKLDKEPDKLATGDFGKLAANFGEEAASVKPTDLKGNGGQLIRS